MKLEVDSVCLFSTCVTVKQLVKVKYPKSWNTDICWDLNLTNPSNFQSLEVVNRNSETQLQVTENKHFIVQGSKGLISIWDNLFFLNNFYLVYLNKKCETI